MASTPRKRSWAAISSIIAAGILIFDFFTKAIGIVDIICDWIVPPPTPSVRLSRIDEAGGGECLEFAFTNLSKDFALGNIHLHIVGAKGPSPISGDMAAEAVERIVNMILSPDVLSGDREKIVFRAPIQSEKRGDIAYVDFCPILATPGMRGEIQIVPSFFSPAGTLIKNIEIVIHDRAPDMQNITIDLSHPKNVAVSLDETKLRMERR